MRKKISLTKKCFNVLISALFILVFMGGKALAEEEKKEAVVAESPEVIAKGKGTKVIYSSQLIQFIVTAR